MTFNRFSLAAAAVVLAVGAHAQAQPRDFGFKLSQATWLQQGTVPSI